MYDFFYLNENDMVEAGVLDMERCIKTMEEVMVLLSKDDYLMGGRNGDEHGIQLIFPRHSDIPNFPLYDAADRRFMAMPGYLGGRFHIAGNKWYGSNGANKEHGIPRSILMLTLNNVETGAPLAYMQANLLSSMRTGAMPGLTAKHLARKGSKVLALIGAGPISKACFRAYMASVPTIEVLKIKGSSQTSRSAAELAKYAAEKYPALKIEICATLEEAVRGSDIVNEAVSSKDHKWPVFQPEWFKPGCLLLTLGSMDIDLDFMRTKMTKVVDEFDMYFNYVKVYEEEENGKRVPSGNPGMYWADMVLDNKMKREEVLKLGDIVRGLIPGRTSDDEIIIASTGGMPMQDLAWGYECYKKAVEKGIGQQLTLCTKPVSF